MLKILLVVGARPNFVKAAPLIHAIERHNRLIRGRGRAIECRLIHTGQHYDERMSKVFFDELGIPAPDENLGIGSGTHAEQTAHVMLRFEPVCLRERPDWVVVLGDVNSTLACTLVAAKLGIPVAHVEAGLRSFDHRMPEELNRVVTDALADILLTPSEDGDENLRHEGVSDTRIRRVGNIMIDALVEQLGHAEQAGTLERLGLTAGGYVYVTLHRPSNVDDPETLRLITREIGRLADEFQVVFPSHPRTRARMAEFGLDFHGHDGIRMLEPMGYLDSINLTRHARFVLTDSGGLQEESTYFRTPCLTLRPNTERPVTIRMGSNRLTSPATLRQDIRRLLAGPPRMGRTPPLWDGRAAGRIVDELIALTAREREVTHA